MTVGGLWCRIWHNGVESVKVTTHPRPGVTLTETMARRCLVCNRRKHVSR